MEYSSMEELETKIDTNLVEFRKILNQLSDLGLFKAASDLSTVFHNESYLRYCKGMEETKIIYK
tara:strand:- start:647 stop:838 length:192 start_codon:yes stop_codon:yes gene_type:complete